jgi:hypothetical protein
VHKILHTLSLVLFHNIINSFTLIIPQSLTCSYNQSFIYSFFRFHMNATFTNSITCTLIFLYTYSFTHQHFHFRNRSLVHTINNLCTLSYTYSFINFFINLPFLLSNTYIHSNILSHIHLLTSAIIHSLIRTHLYTHFYAN